MSIVQTMASPQSSKRGYPWLCWGFSRGFVVRECEVDLAHLPAGMDGLRILHISDLHLKEQWHEVYDQVIECVGAMAVDLVFCTGDIVNDRRAHQPAMPQVARLLPALKSRLGLYTILGNHDHLAMRDEMEALGLNVLSGKRCHVDTGVGALELIGTPGLHRRHLRSGFGSKFGQPVKGVPRIILAHFPDHFEKLSSLEPDLYLCGHTHGGQVCLPGGIPIIRHDQSARHLCRGHHRRGKTHYVVNHGLGFSGLDLRLFCPPELVLITLRRHATRS